MSAVCLYVSCLPVCQLSTCMTAVYLYVSSDSCICAASLTDRSCRCSSGITRENGLQTFSLENHHKSVLLSQVQNPATREQSKMYIGKISCLFDPLFLFSTSPLSLIHTHPLSYTKCPLKTSTLSSPRPRPPPPPLLPPS